MANFGGVSPSQVSGMNPTQLSALGEALQPRPMLPQQPGISGRQFIPSLPAAPAAPASVPLVAANSPYTPGAVQQPAAAAPATAGPQMSPYQQAHYAGLMRSGRLPSSLAMQLAMNRGRFGAPPETSGSNLPSGIYGSGIYGGNNYY